MKTTIFVLICLCLPFVTISQPTIGTFNSVQPMSQTQSLRIPSTHTFQRIIKSGDALTAGGTLGTTLDFTGYIPISGSSTNGYLSISSENTPAACAILNINFNSSTALWQTTSSGNVSFAGLGNTSRFCSGGIMPWGTVVVSEESVTTGDANGDGYDDVGWHIEIDPSTRTVVNQDGLGGIDKVWSAGRVNHENICMSSDQRTAYFGADDPSNGYVYKYVTTTAGDLISGTLYVLRKTSGSITSTTGTWVVVPNSTQVQRNTTFSLSAGLSATNFNGVEDVEIGTIDGKIYFTAKGPGRVYRFKDNGTVGMANDVEQFEIYVESQNYDVDGAGPFTAESWGTGNDNLAFDGEGNLWVLQDGGRNHIWVVGPLHTPGGTDYIRLFATTPSGCEPTGITFTPDYKFIFLSFQGPSGSNTATLTDAAGTSVVFNTHTTVVIGRNEVLGPAALPVVFSSFDVLAKPLREAELNWSTSMEEKNASFKIERSTDGITFEEIASVPSKGNSITIQHYQFTDKLSIPGVYYYRIKQLDIDGHYSYTLIRQTEVESDTRLYNLYPNPASDGFYVELGSDQEKEIYMEIIDASGRKIHSANKTLTAGYNKLYIETRTWSKGNYSLIIKDPNPLEVVSFTVR